MTLAAGERLGLYEVLSAVGAGGMGEVYRARDTRLQRDVALKVLPDAFANSPDRMARFQREAKVLASLNHPNIAAIYGVEERALAMEFVEGKMLAGPLPVASALDYARQMAEALEYAHERGVIHRDLKPANVKVTPEGVVKLLDFGLAKAIEDPLPAGDPVNSPTLTLEATRAGVILGTAGYMSPEQANGKTADRRADIWSFGAVLYELLTGKPAFKGESVSDTLASVLKLDPDWSALPAETPAAVRTLLTRCLTKDRKERLQAIGEARIVLRNPGAADLKAAPPAAKALSRAGIAGMIAGGVIAMIVGAALLNWLRPAPPQSRPVTHFTMPVPASSSNLPTYIAMSRDGSRMAFKRFRRESGPIYLRTMDDPVAKPIPGTENALAPEFSPDGQWICFIASTATQRQLRKVPVSGGGSLTLANVDSGSPWLNWGEDGNILFVGGGSLLRVPAAGGKPETLSTVDANKGESHYAAPQLLPGEKEVLVNVIGNVDDGEARIVTLNLQTREKKNLLESAGIGRYLPSEPGSSSGYIVYGRAASLFAVAFDVNRLRAGSPVPVLEGVRTFGPSGTFGVSHAGTLAYLPGGDSNANSSTLVWVDRQGAEQPVSAPRRGYDNLRISPDGTRVALRIRPGELWVYDLGRGALTPIARGKNTSPAEWTPGGNRLLYLSSSSRSPGVPATGELVSAPSDGSRSPSVLVSEGLAHFPASVSPDGKLAMGFRRASDGGPGSASAIWVLPLTPDISSGGKPQMFIESQYGISGGRFSPDGRWVSYQSTESGVTEVYVVPYPGPGTRVQISTEGGSTARWASNGREMFYQNRGRMMAVDIQTSPVFRAGRPRMLFEKPLLEFLPIYDVAPDGSRFLMLKVDRPAAQAESDELHVVVNWAEELRRRVPPQK